MGTCFKPWLIIFVVILTVTASANVSLANPAESALSRITKAGEMRAGWVVTAPFSYRDNNGKLTGFSVDYIEEMGRALNVKVTWVESPIATLVAGLAADKYEIQVNMNRTFPRILVAEFTQPIAVTKKAFLIRKTDREKLRSPDDLHNPNVRVGHTLGDATTAPFAAMFPEPKKISFPGWNDVILSLSTGQIDVVPADLQILLATAQEHSNLEVPPNSAWLKNDFGFYVKQGDQIWLNWVNWFIRDSKMNGTIERLIKKYGIKGMEVAPY